MDKHKVILVVLLTFSAVVINEAAYDPGSAHHYNELYIDCGATNRTAPTLAEFSWETDEQFIKAGENIILPKNTTSFQMNTLRFFPKGNKNCYKLPFWDSGEEFLFRAGFYYGNYDGQGNPPSFRIEIDGNFWANVTTSMSEDPVYHELIYVAKADHVRVCLLRTKDDGIPFISSLEAVNVYELRYTLTSKNKTALFLHSRINYGANKSIEQSIGPYIDPIQRIWTSTEIPEYLNIHSENVPNSWHFLTDYEPPQVVMAYAIQAKNITDSIHLSFDFSPQTSTNAFFVLYFMDPVSRPFPNETSIVEIIINNKTMAVVVVQNFYRHVSGADTVQVITLFPVQVGAVVNVTIAPARGMTLPPILNAMEIYSVRDVSTAANDLHSYLAVFFSLTLYFLLDF